MSKVKRAFLYLFTLLYVGSGVRHFTDPAFYVAIMPPYLPLHLELVYLSGIIEIALGILILLPKFRSMAAWATIAMLISFMPVHIHMVMNPTLYPEVPEVGLWIRLPIQGLFILWAWWFTGKPEDARAR
jgi:uncharacterized membrane protein